MAQKAGEMGMAALWRRDVPFYDPDFRDVGQILDTMMYAGWLAAVARDIAIGPQISLRRCGIPSL
jgi:alkanesulfonate monooxygenase SsuD/methylene tetrahydromethanopterin reductase-like flavin-dependent oxidoreductase (luciferase family)